MRPTSVWSSLLTWSCYSRRWSHLYHRVCAIRGWNLCEIKLCEIEEIAGVRPPSPPAKLHQANLAASDGPERRGTVLRGRHNDVKTFETIWLQTHLLFKWQWVAANSYNGFLCKFLFLWEDIRLQTSTQVHMLQAPSIHKWGGSMWQLLW